MDDAVLSSIAAKISESPIPPATPEPPPAAPQEAPQEAQTEAAPNQQVEGGDAPQVAPEEPEQPVAEIPLDQLEAIALEVVTKGDDGSDVTEKPTIKELREGYMRQKDYSRKTADIARQRGTRSFR